MCLWSKPWPDGLTADGRTGVIRDRRNVIKTGEIKQDSAFFRYPKTAVSRVLIRGQDAGEARAPGPGRPSERKPRHEPVASVGEGLSQRSTPASRTGSRRNLPGLLNRVICLAEEPARVLTFSQVRSPRLFEFRSFLLLQSHARGFAAETRGGSALMKVAELAQA